MERIILSEEKVLSRLSSFLRFCNIRWKVILLLRRRPTFDVCGCCVVRQFVHFLDLTSASHLRQRCGGNGMIHETRYLQTK